MCLISVIRTVWLNQSLYAVDRTWYLLAIANWSTTEINVAVICGCMPTLRPVLTKVFGPVADRIFPYEPSHETSSARPQTIGSVPMNAFRFGRGSKSQGATMPSHLDMAGESRAEGGNQSTTDLEANGGGSEYRHNKDMDSDSELVAGGSDSMGKACPGTQGQPNGSSRR